jgi:hypothetical protein
LLFNNIAYFTKFCQRKNEYKNRIKSKKSFVIIKNEEGKVCKRQEKRVYKIDKRQFFQKQGGFGGFFSGNGLKTL